MKNITEIVSVIGAVLASFISIIALWNVTRGILAILATIERKLTVLRSLFITLRGEFRSLQKFLKIHHGYHIREDIQDVQEDLLKQYDSDTTGF